jgi:hypothetical protein
MPVEMANLAGFSQAGAPSIVRGSMNMSAPKTRLSMPMKVAVPTSGGFQVFTVSPQPGRRAGSDVASVNISWIGDVDTVNTRPVASIHAGLPTIA